MPLPVTRPESGIIGSVARHPRPQANSLETLKMIM